jgi:hypothetical protein
MPKNHTRDASRGHAGKGTEWKVNGHKHSALYVKKNAPLFYSQISTSVAAKLEHSFFSQTLTYHCTPSTNPNILTCYISFI